MEKFDNFITFGLSKEFLGLVRAKDGELLDKTAIRDGMEGEFGILSTEREMLISTKNKNIETI